MKTSNCLALIAEHEQASNDYLNAETDADRRDALEEINDLETRLWKGGCR